MKPLVSVVIVTRNRKKDLIECVDSFIESSYKPIEIIVVDNGSNPPLLTWFHKNFPRVKLITCETNLGAAEGRNRGFNEVKGKYILFSDDDARADKDMVKYLVLAFEQKKNAGIVQPLVYDKQKKNMLQGAGHDIDLRTGRVKAWGVREIDRGQYEGLREVPLCGCVWMVKAEVFKKVGNYDADYFIPYEDSDFSLRARKAGFKIYCFSKAKTWHQGQKVTYVHPWIEWLGITSAERAFRVARNKMIYMRKHSPFPYNLFFFFILLPFYITAHSLIIAATWRFDILFKYWLGIFSGAWYALTYPLRRLEGYYRKIDASLYPVKMFLLAWTEPVTWVIDKSAESVLDIGCGQGKPMFLIKQRMKVKRAVGVDLFEPYIDEARKQRIHDGYLLQDIRKINFKEGSFDVTLASHVLEHLRKKDALKVLKKMEKTAKKQVIVACPIGEMYHPAVDGNKLQLHLSKFYPEDFEKRGYKIVRYGWKWLLGSEGLVHKMRNDLIRKILYTFNIIAVPIYYLFPKTCDYTFVAYKSIESDL